MGFKAQLLAPEVSNQFHGLIYLLHQTGQSFLVCLVFLRRGDSTREIGGIVCDGKETLKVSTAALTENGAKSKAMPTVHPCKAAETDDAHSVVSSFSEITEF